MALEQAHAIAREDSQKTLGKGAGIIGAAKEIADSAEVWKTEGPTDCATLLSFGPAVAWTNVHGAGEKPTRWICEKFAGKVVNIAHDADTAGKSGAERWAAALNQFADVRIVELPDGYDVRRFLTEAQQRHLLDGKPPGEAASLAFDELTALAGKAELMPRDARTKGATRRRRGRRPGIASGSSRSAVCRFETQ